ncbi:hypothetical protein [uncultured Duncaniella sp.]|uniref:hypothetical protein n=1 Tax=uncultured Duncaniella sp. TaxID=2768039 RepID=UPI0025A5BE41|nr:hypothetical protein [uncultured Duncaniella sp.]
MLYFILVKIVPFRTFLSIEFPECIIVGVNSTHNLGTKIPNGIGEYSANLAKCMGLYNDRLLVNGVQHLEIFRNFLSADQI